MYKPTPIHTGDIKLPESVNGLLEVLAENTHEHWSEQRIKDGWSYGEERDDVKLLHPCLVPYDELPESEKQYDRTTSKEALKVIIAAGFTITKVENNE